MISEAHPSVKDILTRIFEWLSRAPGETRTAGFPARATQRTG